HGQFLAAYWQEFESHSSFKVILDGEIGKPTMVTTSGQKPVGSLISNRETGGAVLLLPYVELSCDDFTEEVPEEGWEEANEGAEEEAPVELAWTEAGTAFGARFTKAL
ncbi:MAG: hypothetical protein GWN86_07105, partial [Desulfobacterales bacterium]|nr:hypothetical protein [Desulfobacterales bacterium]